MRIYFMCLNVFLTCLKLFAVASYYSMWQKNVKYHIYRVFIQLFYRHDAKQRRVS